MTRAVRHRSGFFFCSRFMEGSNTRFKHALEESVYKRAIFSLLRHFGKHQQFLNWNRSFELFFYLAQLAFAKYLNSLHGKYVLWGKERNQKGKIRKVKVPSILLIQEQLLCRQRHRVHVKSIKEKLRKSIKNKKIIT